MFHFPPPLLMSLAAMLLLAPGRAHAQKSLITEQPSSKYPIGHLCCPENHSFEETGICSPLLNSTEFNPPVQVRNPAFSAEDVIWEHHTLECPVGYDARALDIFSLSLDEHGMHFQWFNSIVLKTENHYCVGLRPSGQYVGVTCRPNEKELCSDATCVRKCCGEGKILGQFLCVPEPRGVFSFEFQTVSGIGAAEPADLRVLYEVPGCSPIIKHDPALHPSERFYLLENGVLYHPETQDILQENQFCLDYEMQQNSSELKTIAMVCSGPGLPTEPSVKIYIYAAGTMVSAVFLLVTILFHIFIPKLWDMQSYCLLSHMISLLFANVGLFVGYLYSNDIDRKHCVANGFIVQYSLLATFFWLNVMCYDIWRVIRATVNVIPLSTILASDKQRFRRYSAYAWGVPFTFTVATLVTHYLPEKDGQTFLRPGFGVISCWFVGDLERLAFFYGVVAVLFVANTIILGHTILLLHQAGAAFQCCRKAVIRNTCDRGHLSAFWQRFSLFTMMVLCWITEILSWKIPPEELWIATDVINTLQGFIVFAIFISSKKKREILVGAFGPLADAARKFSRSESSGAIWHTSLSTSSTYGTQGSSSQSTGVELNGRQGANKSGSTVKLLGHQGADKSGSTVELTGHQGANDSGATVELNGHKGPNESTVKDYP